MTVMIIKNKKRKLIHRSEKSERFEEVREEGQEGQERARSVRKAVLSPPGWLRATMMRTHAAWLRDAATSAN
jgi:hypothetical protein